MIEHVATKSLKAHPKNPNRHSAEQIDRLAQLIQYQGWRLPILVSKQSGYIVSGHGRWAAAKKLKLKEVPVIYQDFMDSDQEYAFLVSDNAIASWSALDLSQINVGLQDLGPDFDLNFLGIKDFKLDFDPEQSDEDYVKNTPQTTEQIHTETLNGLIKEPKIEDFKEMGNKKMKFYTCPHCDREFEERTAMVRIDG
jgi:hypothetical protein